MKTVDQNHLTIGKASRILGVSTGTLRRWELSGQIEPIRTPAGHRRYSRAQIDSIAREMKIVNSGDGKSLIVLLASSEDRVECLNNYCLSIGCASSVVIRVNQDTAEDYRENARLAEFLIKDQVDRIIVCTMDEMNMVESFVLALVKRARVEILITNTEEQSN